MTIDEAIVHAREIAEEQRVKKRTCGNCKYCKKSYIHPRQGYCYFNAIHYEHDLIQKACSDWESNDDIGCECAEEQEQLAMWLEELKEIRKWKSDIISEFAKYDATCADEIYQKGKKDSIDEIKQKIDEEYYDGGYGDYHEVAMIVRMIEQMKEGAEC